MAMDKAGFFLGAALLGAAGGAFLGSALLGGGGKPGPAVCTVPQPPHVNLGDAANITAQQVGELIAYANSKLSFPRGHPYEDERELTIKEPATGKFVLGPKASARPASCAHTHSDDDLAEGRIVARIQVAGNQAYDKLKLPAGVSYVWIDKLGERGASIARALILSPGNNSVAAAWVTEIQGSDERTFPEARWLFVPQDDHLWVSCSKYGCCETGHNPW